MEGSVDGAWEIGRITITSIIASKDIMGRRIGIYSFSGKVDSHPFVVYHPMEWWWLVRHCFMCLLHILFYLLFAFYNASSWIFSRTFTKYRMYPSIQ